MRTVRKISSGQKNQLTGKRFKTLQIFNPVQDADGNWFISNEEVEMNENKDMLPWINSLQEIPYNPIPYKP